MILLIDGSNLFIQNWHAFQAFTQDGQPAGGYAGFLTMLSRFISEFSPTSVYVAWEHNSAASRRKIFPEYKANRGKLSREDDSNRTMQLLKIMRTLQHTPVCQLYIDGAEGDDVLAYLCTDAFPHIRKMIVSTDRDFYQLLDANTTIYSPVRREVVDRNVVLRKFGIIPENFALFKALCGDSSDNIPGIRGIGLKTLTKNFPELASSRRSPRDIYDVCMAIKKKNRAHMRITESLDDIILYMSVIELDGSMLEQEQRSKIDAIVSQHERSIDRLELIRALSTNSVAFNQEAFLEAMNRIVTTA